MSLFLCSIQSPPIFVTAPSDVKNRVKLQSGSDGMNTKQHSFIYIKKSRSTNKNCKTLAAHKSGQPVVQQRAGRRSRASVALGCGRSKGRVQTRGFTAIYRCGKNPVRLTNKSKPD